MQPATFKLLPFISVTRDMFMPVDSLGVITVNRDALIPVDSMGWAVRDAFIPVDSLGWAVRDAFIPVDSQGHDPFALAHDWNVRTFFSADLFHQWNVTQVLFSQSITHNWTVIGQGFGMSITHSWRVLPNIPATFGVNPDGTAIPGTDLQCPTATITIS